MKRLVQLATIASACSLAVLIGTSAVAGASPLKTAATFNGTYSGTTGTWTSLFAPSLSVSPAELGTGGSATFTTIISATRYASEWTCSTTSTLCHPDLIVAGFGHGVGNSRLEGDGSLLYGQDNSMGAGYCANDQFYAGHAFIFGTGAPLCFAHNAPLGSTETYSVTITGTNTFNDTVTSSTGHSATFAGTLGSTPTTSYTPAIYLLPGRTSTDASFTWRFTVSRTTLSVAS